MIDFKLEFTCLLSNEQRNNAGQGVPSPQDKNIANSQSFDQMVEANILEQNRRQIWGEIHKTF
jgi:hypothetical protein